MGFRDNLRNQLGRLVGQPRVDAAPPMPTATAPAEVVLPVWGEVESIASRLDGIVNAFTGLGGLNDKGQVARPIFLDRKNLSDLELTELLFSNGISRRIVELVPNEATRAGWSVTASDDEDDDEEPEIDATMEEDQRLFTFDRTNQAMKMARLYGGSVMLMVTEDDIPPEFFQDGRRTASDWLAEPLDLNRVIRLNALQVFDTFEAFPLTFESDINQPGYRDPLIWSLAPTIPFSERSISVSTRRVEIGSFSRVHASRLLFFRGAKRPPSWRHQGSSNNNRALDDSILQAVWNEIRDLTSVMQGGATLAQELRESVVTVAGLKGIVTADQATAFNARMKLMSMGKALLGLIVLGEGDKYENRSNPPTGFKELSGEAQTMLSAVTGIPQVQLFGTVPSGFGKDDVAGRQQFDRLISTAQTNITPQLNQLYEVVFAAKEGPTSGVIPKVRKVVFAPLDELNERQVAEIREFNAKTDAIYLDRGVLPADAVTEARFGVRGYQTDIIVEEPTDEEVEAQLAAEAKAEMEAEAAATALTAEETAAIEVEGATSLDSSDE